MRIRLGSADREASRGRRSRRMALGVAAVAVALAATACGGDTGESAAPPAVPGVKLGTPGKLKVCTNLPYEPFQFKQGDKIVGFDVDLMDLVAEKLGVTQEIVEIDFDSIKGGTALNANRCDVAAAGMTITDERKQNLDFSSPYFDEVIALMAAKGPVSRRSPTSRPRTCRWACRPRRPASTTPRPRASTRSSTRTRARSSWHCSPVRSRSFCRTCPW
ncbi:MAG: ABC transporter substrate-binding protein [Streptomyces sp.]